MVTAMVEIERDPETTLDQTSIELSSSWVESLLVIEVSFRRSFLWVSEWSKVRPKTAKIYTPFLPQHPIQHTFQHTHIDWIRKSNNDLPTPRTLY